MRRTLQTILYGIALIGAAAGAVSVAERAVDEIEVQTGAAVRGALSRSEIDWAWVEVDGMRATLRGPAPDEAARFRALAAAGEVLSPLNLRDEMAVAVPVRRPGRDFRVEFLRNNDSILLHGLAPATEDPMLPEAGGETALEIVDLVARSSDPVPDGWQEALDVARAALAELRTVRVIVTPGQLELDGIAPDRETAIALENRIEATGLATDVRLQLPRPVLSPYIVRFSLDEGGPRFSACAAESRAGREIILAAAAAAGPVTGDCRAALGAPDPNWSETVAEGLALIATLGAGTITFSDLSVTLSAPAEILDDDAFDGHLARFELALPDIYKLEILRADSSDQPSVAALRFSATRSPEGLINLRGPVGLRETRQVVETYAKARFSDVKVHTAFQGGTALPDDWPVQVMAAIDALARLDTGAVTLTPGMVEVRGTTGNPEAETEIARALTRSAGPTLGYALDVTYVAALDPVIQAQGPDPEECVARVNTILEENEVSFPPGSVEIDTEAYDTVGAIAEVLVDCAEVRMEIGGHTDSQGSEDMNQLLSQARADAVLNELMARRVLVANLTTRGYGETQPIADNDTPEGREANRRIRFSLLDEDDTVDGGGSAGDETDPAAGPAPEDAAEDGQEDTQDG